MTWLHILLYVLLTVAAVSGLLVYLGYISVKISHKDGFSFPAPTMVLFYSNQCSHCKNMMAAWNKFKQEMQGRGMDIYEYEASHNSEIIQEQGVKAFPEIRLYTNNKLVWNQNILQKV